MSESFERITRTPTSNYGSGSGRPTMPHRRCLTIILNYIEESSGSRPIPNYTADHYTVHQIIPLSTELSHGPSVVRRAHNYIEQNSGRRPAPIITQQIITPFNGLSLGPSVVGWAPLRSGPAEESDRAQPSRGP